MTRAKEAKLSIVPTTIEGACELIADMALIPPETRRWFMRSIEDDIRGAIEDGVNLNWREVYLSRKAHHRHSLRRIEGAAKDLVEAIEKITDGAEVCLWKAFFRRRHFLGSKMPVEQIQQEYRNLMELIGTVPTIASDAVDLANF